VPDLLRQPGGVARARSESGTNVTHPLAALSDEQLVDELLQYAPEGGKDSLRADFSDAIYRYRAALQEIPAANPGASLLDIGARLYTASIYVNRLGYGRVSIATKWKSSFTDDAILASIPGGSRISLQHFDAETDRFPYEDGTFDAIVCTEVIEHLAIDPMHMLAEMNRVARDGGLLIMTTPNAASFNALAKVMAGRHPYSWAPYSGQSTDRHNREYTITELERAVNAAGFDVAHSATIAPEPFSLKERLRAAWISIPDVVRGKPGLDMERMRTNSLVVGRKAGPVRDRYPGWLYYDPQRGH
jgi:SAM-dependent methyltransferase